MRYRCEVIDLKESGRGFEGRYRYGVTRNGAVIACFKEATDAEEVAWSMTLGRLLVESMHADFLDLLFEYFSRLKGLA